MSTVIMHNVVSVDGFIADLNDDPGPLHEWCFGGDVPIGNGDKGFDHSGAGVGFKVAAASAPYVQAMWDSIGVIELEQQCLLEDPDLVIQGESVLHLRYRVRR